MGNDVACQMIGIGTVRIKKFDSVVRDLTNVRCVPRMKNISVRAVESKGLKVNVGGWNSQGHEWVHGCDEGCQRKELVLLEG